MTVEDLGERARRDEAILDHVELYRLTIAPAVERLFFSEEKFPGGGAQRAADALAALVRLGKLVAHKFPKARGGSTGETYYAPPPNKSTKKSSDAQGVNFDLQTLWLCALSETRCYRLSLSETRGLFPTPPHHHVRHVIGDLGDGPFVSRIYPSSVDVSGTVANLKKFINEARSKHRLGDWIDSGDYGFCVLADHPQKVERVAEAVMSKRQGAGALADLARIEVAFAPTAGNVSQAMSEL